MACGDGGGGGGGGGDCKCSQKSMLRDENWFLLLWLTYFRK